MRISIVLQVVVATLAGCSRLTPPVLPLFVRNPYLSAWLPNVRQNQPWAYWPMFWTGESIGFSILASLPSSSVVYPLLGRPHDSLPHNSFNVSFPSDYSYNYDASTTNLTYSLPSDDGGPLTQITLSFLSPVTPSSTVRQSIPAAYLSVHVTGNTCVGIYIDINGQWVSGDRANSIVWGLEDHQDIKTWRVTRQVQQLFTEHRDRAEWGSLYFSGPSDVSHEAGISALLRQDFARAGALKNRTDNNFRRIMDEEPVFAFSKQFHSKLKSNSTLSTESATFTIALLQEPVVQFAAARGLTMMRPLWKSYFNSAGDLLNFHHQDFKTASALAATYDEQLARDAYKSGAEDYVDIVTLSARQVLGATVFSGTPDNPILFLKEISSNGNFQTIDVIFPAFPFFLYTNPRWLAYLLEPLIEHMLSGQYPKRSAMHDLGTHFPNATGHPDGNDEYMPVEECGNILIMGLALANTLRGNSSTYDSSADPDHIFPLAAGPKNHIDYLDDPWSTLGSKDAKRWVDRSYSLWKQWTQYLVDFSLRPQNQLSTDDFAGWLALQTGLALKGIIGINAMSELAKLTGNDEDAKFYKNISTTYIGKWEEYAISRDKTHAKVAYDWYGSWTTLYNLFADSLLCFHVTNNLSTNGEQAPLQQFFSLSSRESKTGFVPKHIYQMQSDWYWNVRQKYGVPLDSRHLYTKTDWEFFAAAVAAPQVRAGILQLVAKWVNETETDRPLTDLHDTEHNGGFPGPNFFARPVVGGHFAFLTLDKACGTVDLKPPPNLDVVTILKNDMADGEAMMSSNTSRIRQS